MPHHPRLIHPDNPTIPVFLLREPAFARLRERIGPASRAACEVFALIVALAVLQAAVVGCKAVGVLFGVVGEVLIPRQRGDGELGAS